MRIRVPQERSRRLCKDLSREPLKQLLDQLVERYKTADFIPADPISFPNRYRNQPQACEIVAFIAAMFSYGRRDLILPAISKILAPMSGDPIGFLAHFDPKRDTKAFEGFVYRFNRSEDVIYLLQRLQWIYREFDSLENFFIQQSQTAPAGAPLKTMAAKFMDGFLDSESAERYGVKFLLAHPDRGGGCKRLNMFLRWMTRQEDNDTVPIDFGLWRRALKPDQLIIPLDTHVGDTARRLSLTQRKSNDWRTAEEITHALGKFCPHDPVKYDFALFGFGISKDAVRRL